MDLGNLTPTNTENAAICVAILQVTSNAKARAKAEAELMRMASELDAATAYSDFVDCSTVSMEERYRYVSPCPAGYTTILGYIARVEPWSLKADLWEAQATLRDGWWCKHRATERGLVVHKVPAPAALVEQGIRTVNAYPERLVAERLGVPA